MMLIRETSWQARGKGVEPLEQSGLHFFNKKWVGKKITVFVIFQ